MGQNTYINCSLINLIVQNVIEILSHNGLIESLSDHNPMSIIRLLATNTSGNVTYKALTRRAKVDVLNQSV